jgi:hypothetical protein
MLMWQPLPVTKHDGSITSTQPDIWHKFTGSRLHRNIQEALRLFPPLIMLMRYVKETFSVADSKGRQFVIPRVNTPTCLPLSHPSRCACILVSLLRTTSPDRYNMSASSILCCSMAGQHRGSVASICAPAASCIFAARCLPAGALCPATRGGQGQALLIHWVWRRPARLPRPELCIPADQGGAGAESLLLALLADGKIRMSLLTHSSLLDFA